MCVYMSVCIFVYRVYDCKYLYILLYVFMYVCIFLFIYLSMLHYLCNTTCYTYSHFTFCTLYTYVILFVC